MVVMARLWTIGAVGIVVLVVASCSTPATGSIHGLLADCGGIAPGGVYPQSGTVSLTGNGVQSSVHTRDRGRFTFDNLLPGTYVVYVGHRHYPEQSVSVKAGTRSTVTLCIAIP